jgi:hypothetical protein
MSASLREVLRAALIGGLLMTGCSGEPNPPGDGSDDGAGDSGDGADDGAADGGEEPDPIQGRYEVATTYDLAASPLVPGAIEGALVSLTQLADDPAGTLLDLLDQANVPVLDQLLAVVPDVLVDQLAGFINEFLIDRVIENVPVLDQVVGITDSVAGLLTGFDVVSLLDVSTMDDAGAARANHRLSAVRFGWDGQPLLVDTPELLDQITIARDVGVSVSLGGGDGVIELGDHAFHLPIGDFAVVALNQALSQTLGVGSLRDALGLLFDCAGLAESVANRCLPGPVRVCVGHQEELEQVCDAGLDLVASQVEERLTAIDFAEMRFESGSAVLRDAAEIGGAEDGRIDLIDRGTWQTQLQLDGVGGFPLPSPFAGHRVTD